MLMLFFSFCLLRYYFIKMSFMHYYIMIYKSCLPVSFMDSLTAQLFTVVECNFLLVVFM